MQEQQEMRKVYCDTMIALAEQDERIVNIQADLAGAHGMKPFAERFPHRSFNVGIAESNMAGIAAGMAACGKIPFIHSFATFATRRCFDQIAISICYAGLNVKIIGSDPGAGAELNGGTHMAIEDMGIMRTLPEMTIFEPVDSVQLRKALPVITAHEGPVYIRLFRRKAESVFDEDYDFRFGKADILRDGSQVTLVASGICVPEALKAADILASENISARVLNVHTLKPLDNESIIEAARQTGAMVTAENHSIIGGLGSAVAECLAENYPVPLERVGVKDRFGEVGRMPYLMKTFGILANDIVKAAHRALKRTQR